GFASEVSKHQGSQNEIQAEHGQRGIDDGTAGGAADAFGAGLAVVDLEHGDPGHHEGEHHRLDHAVHDVLHEAHAVLHVAPVGTVVDAQPVHRHHGAAPDADHAEDGSQQRHGDEAGPQPRQDHVLERIDADHLQAGQLLGGLHVADLGGQRRTGSPGEPQRGYHRTQLAQQGQRHHLANRLLGTEVTEDIEALQRQHHADEDAGHHDDRQRQHADEVQLPDQQLQAVAQPAATGQHVEQEDARAPQ